MDNTTLASMVDNSTDLAVGLIMSTLYSNFSDMNTIATTSNIQHDTTGSSIYTTMSTTMHHSNGHPNHSLTLKDHTMLVTLIVMGIIVPGVFIFVIAAICLKRRKFLKNRRNLMLLRDSQEVAMEDLPY